MIDEYVKREKKKINSDYEKLEELNSYQEREKRILDIAMDLLEELAHLRKEKNLSQRDLCAIIDLKQPALAKIEKRKNSPQLSTLIKILDALDYHIEFKKNSKCK